MLINIRGILARHIMKQLLVPFLCCFFGFLFLFFIGDLQDELGDMLKTKGKSMFQIALYFLFILPEKIPLVTPMALLLGTMYCFSNLNKHNEINAIKSSGISIFKLSLPVFLFALFISFSIFISNEFFLGYFSQKSTQLHEQITGEVNSANNIAFSVINDDGERNWNVHFNKDGTYSKIMLQQLDPDGEQIWAIDAAKGKFSKEKGWTFYNVQTTSYPKGASIANAPQHDDVLEKGDFTDDPVTMRNYRSFSGLSLAEINKRKNSMIKFSDSDLQVMDVKFYSLIFTPFACLISVLLGIPLSITQQRQGALASSAKALGIMIGYYILLHVFVNFGNSGMLPAFIAGSVPTLFFLILGLIVSLKK